MPGEDDESTLDEELEKLPNRARQHLRETEKKLKAREAEVEEGRSAKRELAAMRAGIDLSTPVGQLFVKAYDGEWEPEALKGAWSQLGMSASGQNDGTDAEKAAREAERQAAIAGQRNLGEPKFGDILPAGSNEESRLIADLREAHALLKPADYTTALQQGNEAMRTVLHNHNMILADEID